MTLMLLLVRVRSCPPIIQPPGTGGRALFRKMSVTASATAYAPRFSEAESVKPRASSGGGIGLRENLLFPRRRTHPISFSPVSPQLPIICTAECFRRNLNVNRNKWSCSSKDAAGDVLTSQTNTKESTEDEACELVSGTELILGENEDTIHAYLLKAVKNNNGAGILLLSDIFGFEDSSTRDFAYRVACNGYNVLVPDLFRRTPWKKDQDHSEFEVWLAKHPPDRIAKDIATSSRWMMDEFVAAGMSRKLGIIGFCFGGGHLVETLARDNEEYFGTGVSFYGTSIDPSLAAKIKVPILFICGDNDPLCPVSPLLDVEQNVRGSKTVIYPGRGHGFAHRPQSQEEDEDAEDSFTLTRGWLHDHLVVDN